MDNSLFGMFVVDYNL